MTVNNCGMFALPVLYRLLYTLSDVKKPRAGTVMSREIVAEHCFERKNELMFVKMYSFSLSEMHMKQTQIKTSRALYACGK